MTDNLLSDQIVRLLMIWEDGVHSASTVADIITKVIENPDAKERFIKYSEKELRDVLANKSLP